MLGTLRFAQPTQCQFRQSGLTLLEIMITVVILSLGLLGLAGLQLTGLKNNRDAYNNAVAGQAVQDIAERIRADRVGMAANRYDSLFDGNAIGADASKCDDTDADTLVRFKDRAACQLAALPGGSARVREVTAGSNIFYVAVRWTDPQLNGVDSWTADTTTNPATTACGAVAADTRCYYSAFRP
ncbi:MAG: type IV pilus modification protein PilV [Pseudomonadota bacterium]|nr:type IV pilus modification protein PilV [Pseudomonadota bacterium]